MCQAVKVTSGKAAASSQLKLFGLAMMLVAGTATSSA
jgi:hypothetical protein